MSMKKTPVAIIYFADEDGNTTIIHAPDVTLTGTAIDYDTSIVDYYFGVPDEPEPRFKIEGNSKHTWVSGPDEVDVNVATITRLVRDAEEQKGRAAKAEAELRRLKSQLKMMVSTEAKYEDGWGDDDYNWQDECEED